MSDIQHLINFISTMPGLGPRSARRIVLHMLRDKNKMMYGFADLINGVATATQSCLRCNNLDTASICAICNDPNREQNKLCIVEEVGDLWNIEKSGCFRGIYYVMSRLNSHDNSASYELHVKKLIAYIEKLTSLEEIIMANNPTVQGQTTAFYIADMLAEFLRDHQDRQHISITTLGKGIPMGSELDYLDEGTIGAAFHARKSLE